MCIKSIALFGATIVGALALAIGAIGTMKPTLFMGLPFPLSIILWTSFGGEVPPYFMPEAWKDDEIKTWTKPGDLVVSTGGKSGTTWMLFCTHQIRMKGADDADELFEDVSLATPWADLRQSRHGSWEEQKDRYNTTILTNGKPLKDYWDNERYPFRIFKSHYGPKETGSVLPIRDNPKLKFLAMVRNGLDVVNSMVYFWTAHQDVFRNVYGGFPPDSTGDVIIDADQRIHEMLPGGLLDSIWFGCVTQWWEMRNEPNVLLLHYADARKDLVGTVRKLANFLEVDLTESEVKKVSDKCDISYMKARSHMFEYAMPLNNDPFWDNERDRIMKPEQMIRTGKVGHWKEQPFTEEHRQKWHQAEEDVLGAVDPNLVRWAREGGSYDGPTAQKKQ